MLGPNGAGKTTTINLLLGFLTPDAGETRINGASVAQDPIAARRKIAYIPEQVVLYPQAGIALAPATEAKALLLDEPTSGLDPAASHEFSLLLRKLAGRGVAILMATHDLFRAREDATRIGILLDGNWPGRAERQACSPHRTAF